MNKTKKDKQTIYEIHNLSTDISLSDIERVCELLLTKIVLDYADEIPTRIPFLGDFEISYQGDEIIEGKKQAKLLLTLDPDNLIKNLVGRIEDGEINEIDEELIKDVILDLREKIEE